MPQSILDDVAMVSNVKKKKKPGTVSCLYFLFMSAVDAVITNICSSNVRGVMSKYNIWKCFVSHVSLRMRWVTG